MQHSEKFQQTKMELKFQQGELQTDLFIAFICKSGLISATDLERQKIPFRNFLYFRQNESPVNNQAIKSLLEHLGKQVKIVCIENSILGIFAYYVRFKGRLSINRKEYSFNATMNRARGEDEVIEVSGEGEFNAVTGEK